MYTQSLFERKSVAAAIAVFAVTALLYLPTLTHQLVGYDDQTYVVDNVHLKEGLTPAAVKWAVTSRGYASNWHPLAWTSLMADVDLQRLFRRQTELSSVMHAHNVILHAANAALLFLLMAMIAGGRLSSVWLVGLALAWSVHPLRAEVVCWASERKELSSVFFMLLSLLAWCGKRRTFLSLACAALAMLAKPVAVTLPVILFAWDWLIRRENSFFRLVPFGILSALTCLFTMQSQTVPLAVGRAGGLATRLSAVFVSPLVYVRQTLWPFDLSIMYEVTQRINAFALAGGVMLVVLVATVGVAGLLRRGGRWCALAAFAVAWCYVGLVPMLGIVKVGPQEHSDRYTYWIGCGASVVLSMAIARLGPVVRSRFGGEWVELRKLCLGVLAASVAALGFVTLGQMSHWRDSIALYRHALPHCWNTDVARNLAGELLKQGAAGQEEAIYWLRQCANSHRSGAASFNLAEFLYCVATEDKELKKLGCSAYDEVELLLHEALSLGLGQDEARRAKEILSEIKSSCEEGR